MRIFISGTDTSVGKTLISAWLCLHTKAAYFKPIQTGADEDCDTQTVKALSQTKVFTSTYRFSHPVSPHLAARLENSEIHLKNIHLPETEDLIVEGAGGVLTPINEHDLMIDLMRHCDLPTILVARSSLGTINHTLLSLAALRQAKINVLGVIVNGEPHPENCQAIAYYGKTKVLAECPDWPMINPSTLRQYPLSPELSGLFTFSK